MNCVPGYVLHLALWPEHAHIINLPVLVGESSYQCINR